MKSNDSARPMVSVIIPTYNNNKELRTCLSALAEQSIAPEKFEVIVVDNGSSVSASIICAEFPFVRCIDEKIPGSYNARNTGSLSARGQIFAFTDADCIPTREWLERALAYFSGSEALTALGGAVQLTTDGHPNTAELYEKLFALQQEKYVLQDGFAATANLFVRKNVFEEVGFFDTQLLSGGDHDWGKRHRASGRVMHYAADVIIEHPARATLAGLIKKRRRVTGGLRILNRRYTHSNLPTISSRKSKTKLFLQPEQFGLNKVQGFKVFLLWAGLGLVAYSEKLRLSFGGSPIR